MYRKRSIARQAFKRFERNIRTQALILYLESHCHSGREDLYASREI